MRADLSLFGLVGRGLGVAWRTAAAHHGIGIFLAVYALVLLATALRPRH